MIIFDSATFALTEKSTWKYAGASKSNGGDHLEVAAFVGKRDGAKTNGDKAAVKKGFVNFTSDETVGTSATVDIDGETYAMELESKKENVHTFTQTTSPVIKFKLDLNTNTWSFNMSKCDCSTVDLSDGMTIGLQTGAFDDAITIAVTEKTQLKYSNH